MKKRFKRIYIEITNCCNRSCSFCSKGTKPKKVMTLKEFEYILKDITDYTDYLYLHVKGEPLLHPQFKEILNLCKKYNKKVNITTNGTLLLSKIDDIIETNVVRQINISLHNFNNEPQYIKDILTATDKILSTSPIYINYRFWTLQDNTLTKDMEQMIRLILSHYQLNPELLSEIKHAKNMTLKEHLYLNKGELFDWPSLSLPYVSSSGTCHGTKDHIAILSDGTVIPCCLDSDGILSLGNIFTTSFSDILKSDLFKEIHIGFLNHQVVCELCQRCSYRTRFDHA